MAKTNTGLVEYAFSKLGTAYVYGAKMEILTRERYDFLKRTYGSSLVWDSDANKIGRLCCDCSGLISAYTGKYRSSADFRNAAKDAFPIGTISDAPVGALVWKSGHIGIYIGFENGVPCYIAEDGSAYGCRKARLPANFTHWFLCADVEYAGAQKKAVEIIEKVTEISVGDKVTINPGSVYGGLSVSRGAPVPAWLSGQRLTVGRIAVNNGVQEALLTEILSWVAIGRITRA